MADRTRAAASTAIWSNCHEAIVLTDGAAGWAGANPVEQPRPAADEIDAALNTAAPVIRGRR